MLSHYYIEKGNFAQTKSNHSKTTESLPSSSYLISIDPLAVMMNGWLLDKHGAQLHIHAIATLPQSHLYSQYLMGENGENKVPSERMNACSPVEVSLGLQVM